MKKIELFNLYVGDRRLPPSRVGPFFIDLKPDYEKLISRIHQPEKIITDWSGNMYKQDEQKGFWIPTADLGFDENERSILHDSSLEDGGVWDIRHILSFVTGRSVCTSNEIDSNNFRQITGESVCHPVQTLLTVNVAWINRNSIKANKLEYAFLLYTEALNYSSAQVLGFLYNCCFNIFCDQLIDKKSLIDQKTIKLLKTGIDNAIRSVDPLTDCQREKIWKSINPVISSGFSTYLDDMKELLLKFNIINETFSTDTLKRIEFMRKVRNSMIHAGRFPDLQGKSRRHASYFGIALCAGVVAEICRLILGRYFGFSQKGVGEKSQDTHNLVEFFENGVWRDTKIAEETYEELLAREFNEG